MFAVRVSLNTFNCRIFFELSRDSVFRVWTFCGCLRVGAHQAGIWTLWLAGNQLGVCYSSVPSL